jgi:hypothetical protein
MPSNTREVENLVDQDSKSTASTELCELYKESEEDSDVEEYYDSAAVDAWDTGCTDQDTGVNEYYNHETNTTVNCTSFERKVLLSNRSRNMVVESSEKMLQLQGELGKSFRDIRALEDKIMQMQKRYPDYRDQSTYTALRDKLKDLITARKQFQSEFVHVEHELETRVPNYKATLLVIKNEKTNKLIDAQLGLLMVHVTNKGFIEWYANLQARGQSLSEEQVILYKDYFEGEAQYKAVDRDLRKMYLAQKQFQKRQDFEIRDVLETYSKKLP